MTARSLYPNAEASHAEASLALLLLFGFLGDLRGIDKHRRTQGMLVVPSSELPPDLASAPRPTCEQRQPPSIIADINQHG